MRAGCFAENRVIELINRRFVPYFFNRGGPGKGHDDAARKFTVGKTKNPYAYFAAFTPAGDYLGETAIYADKDAVFAWLRQLLADHPKFAKAAPKEAKLLATKGKGRALERARLQEALGEYAAAIESYGEVEDAEERARALLRIARHQKDWKRHATLEASARKLDGSAELPFDLAMERGYRLLAEKKYAAARDLLLPMARKANLSPRLAELHFYTGVAYWFLKDRDHAKFHWCWILDHLEDDRFYMRARVAAAAEIMPYPNPELGNYRARGMIGTGHIVREVAKSMRLYRKLLPEYEGR